MSSFTRLPQLIALPPKYKLYKVPKSFEYHVGNEESSEIIRIGKGFITDGASIPPFAWPLIGGPLGPYAPAAVVHDWIYKYQLYTRKRCDEIFLEAMEVLGVVWWKRRLMFRCVRIFGFWGWRKKKLSHG